MFGVVNRVERGLSGWPDKAITVGLLVAAIVIVVIALYSPSRVFKLGALAWVISP